MPSIDDQQVDREAERERGLERPAVRRRTTTATAARHRSRCRNAALAMLMINIGTRGRDHRRHDPAMAIENRRARREEQHGEADDRKRQRRDQPVEPQDHRADDRHRVCEPSSGPLLAAAAAINASVINAAVVPRAPSSISTAAPARNAAICASGPRCCRSHGPHGGLGDGPDRRLIRSSTPPGLHKSVICCIKRSTRAMQIQRSRRPPDQ